MTQHIVMSSRHVIASCVFVRRHVRVIRRFDVRFRATLARRCVFAFRRAFDARTIFRVEMRTNDVVLRLRENPRRIVFVNVTHIRAQPYAHTFRRDRRVRVVAHDVVMYRFQNDRRRFIRFRVALRHVVFRFRFHRRVIAFDVFNINTQSRYATKIVMNKNDQ